MKIKEKNWASVVVILAVVSMIFTPFANAASIYTTESPNIIVRELKYDPYPLQAGKYVNLWVKIDNYGSKRAENVLCTLKPKYPFSLDPAENATQSIGILPGLESAILEYRIYVDAAAVEGDNEMNIECQTTDDGIIVTRKISLYITSEIPEFAVGSITSQPTKLLPDTKDNMIKIKLQNIGTGDAGLVTAKLILPEGIHPAESYSNIANLGTIAAGAVGETTFYLDIDQYLEPNDYKAQIDLYYRDSNGVRSQYKNQTLDVDINVMPAPVFEIESVSTNPAEITQGDKIDLTVFLKNTGFEEAKSVSFKLYQQNDQPFSLDEKYDFIGNIKPDETGEAGLKITVDSDASLKKHLLEGEIRYLVGNEVFVVNKQIPLRVAASRDSSISPVYIVAGFIVIVLIGIYYVRQRKKK